jgi:hypothetical protein
MNFFSNKGVKVVLDVPDTMWDAPSAEITQLKKYVRQIKKFFFSFKLIFLLYLV